MERSKVLFGVGALLFLGRCWGRAGLGRVADWDLFESTLAVVRIFGKVSDDGAFVYFSAVASVDGEELLAGVVVGVVFFWHQVCHSSW